MQHNFKCSACFGETNDFDIGTPDAPFFQGTTPTLTVDVTDVDGVTPVVLTGAYSPAVFESNEFKDYCFASPAAADALSSQLKTRFGEQLPSVLPVSDAKLVRVQAGPFANPEAADKIAAAWQEETSVRPFRVQH